jgi:hypothetical protein
MLPEQAKRNNYYFTARAKIINDNGKEQPRST